MNALHQKSLEYIPTWMQALDVTDTQSKSVFVQALHYQVQHHHDALAVAQQKEAFTWTQWHQKVHQLSDLMRSAGITRGDHVAVMLENRWEVLALFLALRRIGAVMVPINLLWSPEDMVYVLQHAHPKLLVSQERFVAQLNQCGQFPLPVALVDAPVGTCQSLDWGGEYPLQSFISGLTGEISAGNTTEKAIQIDARQMALLLYTSGTTGRPKGVMLSEENLWANVIGIVGTGMFTSQDRLLVALPLFHCYGFTLSLAAMAMGLPIILEPTFQPKSLLQALIQHRISVLPLVPTLLQVLGTALAKGDVAVPDLRLCVSGGASLPPTVLEQFKDQLGITILEGYGMTEASPVVAVNRLEVGPIAGSVGPALHNVQVRIDGELGEVCIKGQNVMLGYYQNPEATAETMAEDGWLKTGDLGRLDEQGNLYLTGRAKELIIKAGENISPVAIEHALLRHEAIAEVCVFGLPDDKLGERIVAVVVPVEDSGVMLDEPLVKGFARSVLSSFQVPDAVLMWPELPKNGAGKIIRRVVQQHVLALTAG